MTTHNYWCPDSDCPNPSKKRNFRIADDGKIQTCPYCDAELKRLGRTCNNFGRIASMTPVERKKILKKRADVHAASQGEREKRDFTTKRILGYE